MRMGRPILKSCSASSPPEIIVLDEIDSTNAEAMRRAAAGTRAPFWIMARRQTAGRGRSGRAWASEPGNLYASLLVELNCPPIVVSQVSLVAGVALLDAIREAAGSQTAAGVGPMGLTPGLPGLRLKWPNDVLIGHAKLAGILAESTTGPDGRLTVVIGIGVNLAWHPGDLGRDATDLRTHFLDIAPEIMLRHLSKTMDRWLGLWNDGAGFEGVRSAWMERAGALGEALSVKAARGPVSGRYAGLDSDGALLVVRDDGGTERVTYGDVTLDARPRS